MSSQSSLADVLLTRVQILEERLEFVNEKLRLTRELNALLEEHLQLKELFQAADAKSASSSAPVRRVCGKATIIPFSEVSHA